MCGIVGIVTTDAQKYERHVKAMMDSLVHRGPDGDGFKIFNKCLLGHRRLSIIDLSTGDQPMLGRSGTTAVIFNGEIYGYKDLRSRMSSYPFKTTSDTEVILAMYEDRGKKFVERLPGMFAFAIWDENKKSLLAARDRFGEKPFYYAIGKNGEFIFASEIKAILASGLINPNLSKDSLAHYLHKLYVHPSKTIYSNIHTLPPAHMLIYKDGKIEVERYWQMPNTNESITLEEALPELKRLLTSAVKRQLVADVPIGAFLSGGLDSTTVVSLASTISPRIKTFSFGFEGTKNELTFARLAAEAYGTEHHELHDNDYNVADLLLKMADIYDEPFADSSAIPTYLVSKLTREHTKVVLSGDGGDELLGGYHGWYRPLLFMNKKNDHNFPGKVMVMRLLAQFALRKNWRNKVEIISRARGLYYRKHYRNILDAHRASNVYFKEEEIRNLGISARNLSELPSWQPTNTPDDAMKDDIENYMPGDILTKIDRASMANSLELRAPFLDLSLAEFAISLPSRLKINTEEDKIILRRAFEGSWPKPIRSRTKLGFGAPINIWMKRPEMIALKNEYLNDPKKKIYKYLSFNKSKRFVSDGSYKIWILLVLSIWMEKHKFSENQP